jgi:cytolethal distending toxin subunit B
MFFKKNIQRVIISLLILGTTTSIGELSAYAQQEERNIGTWNMQGANAETENKWNEDVANLMNQLDILALQEAGRVPRSANPLVPLTNSINTGWGTINGQMILDGITVREYTWQGTRTRPGYYIYWGNTDPNGNRVNVALVTRQRADQVISFRPIGRITLTGRRIEARRSVIGLRFGNFWYFSVHARSGVSLNSPANDVPYITEGIHNVVDFLARQDETTYRWTALGDWNQDYVQLRDRGNYTGRAYTNDVGQGTYPATDPQSTYDFMITSPDLEFERFSGTVLSLTDSDHLAQKFTFTRRF